MERINWKLLTIIYYQFKFCSDEILSNNDLILNKNFQLNIYNQMDYENFMSFKNSLIIIIEQNIEYLDYGIIIYPKSYGMNYDNSKLIILNVNLFIKNHYNNINIKNIDLEKYKNYMYYSDLKTDFSVSMYLVSLQLYEIQRINILNKEVNEINRQIANNDDYLNTILS